MSFIPKGYTLMLVSIWLLCISSHCGRTAEIDVIGSSDYRYYYHGNSSGAKEIFGLKSYELGTVTVVHMCAHNTGMTDVTNTSDNKTSELNKTAFLNFSTGHEDQVIISLHSRIIKRTVVANRQGTNYKFSLNTVGDRKNKLREREKITENNVQDDHLLNMFVTGFVIGKPGSSVFGKVHDGIFDGVLYTQGETLYVENASKYFQNSTTYQVILYRDTDMVNSYMGTKNIHFENNNNVYCHPRRTNLFRKKRSTPDKLKNRSCGVHVVVDHTFYQTVGANDVKETLDNIILHMSVVNEIFIGTDFDGNGLADNIGIHIDNVTIFQNNFTSGNGLRYEETDATSYLYQFSAYNFTENCLALLFTNHDFENGIIGLAWLASSSPYGPPGGICQKQIYMTSDDYKLYSLNTLLVSHQNWGRPVPLGQSVVAVAHEFGHSFGSNHDDDNDDICAPDGSSGRFIMYPYAVDGTRSNNKLFSPCSRNAVYPVLQNKGYCMIEVSGPICGDRKVEGSEECDCGSGKYCDQVDPCCTPPGGFGSDEGCKLRSGTMCSPQVSPCCDSSCQYIPAETTKLCYQGSECTLSSYCNGSSSECPTPQTLPDGTTCDEGSAVCHSGTCEHSLCSIIKMIKCQCSHHAEACMVCCTDGVHCRTTKYLGLSKDHVYLAPGSLCNQSRGYCSYNQECIVTDYERVQARLFDLFTAGVLAKVHVWIINYWGILFLGAVPLMFFIAVIVVNIRKKAEILHETEYRSVRMAFLWQLALSQCDKLISRNKILDQMFNEKTSCLGQNKKLDKAVALARMSTFFPFAPQNAIIRAIRKNRSEEAAVVQLLLEGHAMRTLM